MIDTHCHLWFKHFSGEVPEVLQRAKDAGLGQMICVGCDEQSSGQSVELAEQYEGVYAAIGLHPNDGKDWKGDQTLAWMRALLQSSEKVVAVGETGIDYFRSADQAELQKEMFQAQCELAQEFDMPVIIHLRSTKHSKPESAELTLAEQDCLRILDDVGMKPGKVLFHCFSSDRTMAKEALDRGGLLSFSGVLTYPNSEELREVVKMCPLEQMVVETDCPFLSPQKHRGERNEPAYVLETAQVVADLKMKSFEEVEAQMDENAQKLFGL